VDEDKEGTINGTGYAGYFTKRRATSLSDKPAEQIHHHLDVRCHGMKALPK